MRLTVLGCNGTYPTLGRPGSGYLIEHEGTRVWCDAGPGTFLAVQEALGIDDIDAVVVSHQHLDHCLDVLTAHHALAFGPRPRTGIPLYAPQAVWDRLMAFMDPEPGDPFLATFRFHAVADGDRLTMGSLGVEFAVTDHSVPTVGSRWQGGGRTLAYSADTGPTGSWSWLAGGADLFLCEASYQGEGKDEPYPHHLTAFQAGEIAAGQGVGRLLLTHLRPTADPARSCAEAEATFGGSVQAARPGLTVEV